MTRERKQSKDFFRLNGGLNTEINELGFPDGFSRDEANYELLADGARRRRKGLADESGVGTARTVATFTAGDKCQSYVWKNVGGDPDKQLLVFRKASILCFADADEIISDSWHSGTSTSIDMSEYWTSGATVANSDNVSVSFAQGRGYLFVTGPYIKSFYVTYTTGDTYKATEIPIKIRDFGDIEDGVAMDDQTTDSPITDDHFYNLRNRGWTETDLTAYLAGQSKNPAKNHKWFQGYKRTLTASTDYDHDGVRAFDHAKMAGEPLGGSSAARGSLFLSPYDTTFGLGLGGTTASIVNISSFTFVDNGSNNWSVSITTDAAHGISVGDNFSITGNSMDYYINVGEPIDFIRSMDGTYPSTAGTSGTTLNFVWDTAPGAWAGWNDQYLSKGQVDGSQALARSNGTTHADSFNAIEFHAGHIFYGGMKNSEFADHILFSQIGLTPDKFGRCYQEADPTDEEFNALTPADGGTIVIPGMGGVLDLVSLRNSLLVLGRGGVWEISGGQRGVFTADGYSARKLSNAGASAPDGWAIVENSLVYSGPAGIMLVAPNEKTGHLEVQNATERTIQTLWNQIPDAEQEHLQMMYDESLRRLYVMYGSDGSSTIAIDTMLIFDARASAWFKYTFDAPTNNVLLTGFPLPNADDTSDNKKVKFLYQASTTTVQAADFDQTSFDDWDGTNGPLPFLLTGHDFIGDWQRRRQAPIITVFNKRTETGYVYNGSSWDPTNTSSTLMSAYWDWTDDAVSNKIGAQQQVYRHVREFVPTGATDVNGYPVAVTRNKVRGRGRSLQLRFDGATDKDSHLLGFSVNYKVASRV